MTGKEVLDIQMEHAGNKVTIRQYFKLLLSELWKRAEGFSGKRPFGDSTWQFDVYKALIKHGFPGQLDEDGYVDKIDMKIADELILEAIDEM